MVSGTGMLAAAAGSTGSCGLKGEASVVQSVLALPAHAQSDCVLGSLEDGSTLWAP